MIGFASIDLDPRPSKPDWWFFRDAVKWQFQEVNGGYKIIFANPEGRWDYWYIGSVPTRIFFDDDTYMDFDDENTFIDFLREYVSKGYYDEQDRYDPLDDMDVL